MIGLQLYYNFTAFVSKPSLLVPGRTLDDSCSWWHLGGNFGVPKLLMRRHNPTACLTGHIVGRA
eukprot:6199739-Pleurochrysis_carterae.AAC.2